MRYEFYGGPLDGHTAEVDEKFPPYSTVYFKLPVVKRAPLLEEPPEKPYTAYILGKPSADKAHYMGEWK